MIEKYISRDLSGSEIERFSQKPYMKQILISSGMPLRLSNALCEGTVYLLVDRSSSMGCKNKMNQAREGSVGFAIEALNKGYPVGLIAFDSETEHLLEPQKEISCIETAVEKMQPGGGTNMEDAILMAKEYLSSIQGKKRMCIVTDGEPNSKEKTLAAAEEAKSMGIEIMVVRTNDANSEFLDKLVTRKELSVKVEVEHFKQGITEMAKLLPDRRQQPLQLKGGENTWKK